MNSREFQIMSHGIPNVLHHVDLAGIYTLYSTLDCVSPNLLLMTATLTDLRVT